MNKVRSKDSKGFSGRNRKFKRFFRPKTDDFQKKRSFPNLQEIFRPILEIQAVFRAEIKWSPKKRSSSQKRHEIRGHSTKNTNLSLDLHSSSPEPVNFSGAQSLLGGAQFSFGGDEQSVGGAQLRYAPRGSESVCCFCKPRFFPTRKKTCTCFQRQGT